MKDSALPSSFGEERDADSAQSDDASALHRPIRPRLSLAKNLTLSQQKAATEASPIQVLAGAGTGKTSTLTEAVVRRIAHDGFFPTRILVVTFTNKAAADMATRIRAALGEETAPSWLGTYHGLAARQLREAPEIAGLSPGFDILDAEDSRRIVKRSMQPLNLAHHTASGNAGDPVKIMCNRLAIFKDSLISPEGAAAWVEAKIQKANQTRAPIDPVGLRAAAQVCVDYQRWLRAANAADFGDLLLWPTRAMHRDEIYRDHWAACFDCLLADEYQDVNFAQYSWLKPLAADHRRLFVVGDDDQAIYSWRGSDISFIRRFTQDFPGALQIRLEENFRSTGHILAAANAVIAKDGNRLGKTLLTKNEPGVPIEILAFCDAQAEAQVIALEIQRRHAEGAQWEDIAILYRNNAMSRQFEEALIRARILYVLIGDIGFYQRAAIKDALALLRLAANPESRQSDEAFRRVINTPRRAFGAKAMDALEAEASFRNVSLLQALETAPFAAQSPGHGIAICRSDPAHCPKRFHDARRAALPAA